MLNRIKYRLKQLFFALTSKMSEEDHNLVHQYLNIKESALFYRLPEYEQKHAVVVAQKMLKAAEGNQEADKRKITRLGLLHDIGKAAIRLSLYDKSIMVVMNRLLPPLYENLAKKGIAESSPRIFRQFYVHKNHAKIGAEILDRISEDKDILEDVKNHDDKKIKSDDFYFNLLVKADNES